MGHAAIIQSMGEVGMAVQTSIQTRVVGITTYMLQPPPSLPDEALVNPTTDIKRYYWQNTILLDHDRMYVHDPECYYGLSVNMAPVTLHTHNNTRV